jgi:hypothetical protein
MKTQTSFYNIPLSIVQEISDKTGSDINWKGNHFWVSVSANSDGINKDEFMINGVELTWHGHNPELLRNVEFPIDLVCDLPDGWQGELLKNVLRKCDEA